MNAHNHTQRPQRKKWTYWTIGLVSLIWLLLRSGTSPHRLAYPCQQTALISSSGFLGYLASLLGITRLYHFLKRKATFIGATTLILALLLISTMSGSTIRATAATVDLTLPGWTSATAISNVFVVPDVPVPECSLDGGTLPGTPPCNAASYALRDDGVDSLIDEMERREDYFYRTTAHPTGVVDANDIVVIKINNQWAENGGGRLCTNTDVLKGLIWRVLQHPDTFTGEVVVAENTQGVISNWDLSPANSQDPNQSYQDVVSAFQSLGHPVSLYRWDDLNDSRISGGDVGGAGYPTGEYVNGNTDDAYILLEDADGTGTDELSYPKFQTTSGISVSMRYGIWNGSSYDADQLTLINLPVLKQHGMAGATIAWKNLIGFVTTYDNDNRYGGGSYGWDEMHDFYWGYTAGSNSNYGLLGRQMALIRTPDLNIVDAVWVADDNYMGTATRQNVLLASTDPFAVDWYASEYVLYPLFSNQGASAARSGTFRSATRTNQNSAVSEWPGGSYPYIDLLDGYDGDTPSDAEKNQMNVYVVTDENPSLTLTSPTGGENWPVSSTRLIQWTTDPPGSISTVNLRFSTDGFVTSQTITLSLSNSGVYTWTTPLTPTTSAQLRVASVASPTIHSTSGAFTLYDVSTFTSTVYLPVIMGRYAPPPPPLELDVTLTVDNPLATARTDEPVTSGVPVPQEIGLTDLSTLRLLDSLGQPVPAQFTPLARWGGAPEDVSKAVRWLLVDLRANVPASGSGLYRLVDTGGTAPTYPTLNVIDGAITVTVDTGAAQFSISKTDGGLTAPHLLEPLFGQAIASGSTIYSTTGPVTVTVALSGPMRVSVHVQGAYRDTGGTPLLDYTSRYWFHAGLPTVRLFHTVENNNLCPLVEYGQMACHDIGSGGSVTVTDLSLVLAIDLGASLAYQAAGEGTPVGGNLTDDVLLYQDSSGTDNWNLFPTFTSWTSSTLDTRPRMQSYVSFRGYSTTMGATTVDSGNYAAGSLSVSGTSGGWSVGVRDFWQNFPKALRASTGGVLEIGLFPDEYGPPGYGFNLRAGEHKTHEIVLSPSNTPPPSHTLFAKAPSEWYIISDAFGLTAPRDWTDWPDHENYVNYQLDTSPDYDPGYMDWYPNLPTAILSTDFYGMFDYGDWPIDYEGYGVATFNAKYDSNYGAWLQWARTSDPRWFDLARAADRHVADIDILHNLHSPRHWGDGIAFGHSYHDEDAFRNPHRNYGGTHPDTAAGMPGLLLSYYLTGYEKAYQAAMELADCIEYRLRNDNHLCSYFPGDCNEEGYGLGAGLYDAGSRPAANSLLIAVSAHRATADSRYLAVADAVVDWADPDVQPYIDCITSTSELLMRPWMLNMYLRALADYIEMRDEFGLPDTYDAQTSFTEYADWLGTCALLSLEPIDTGSRAAYPYEWFLDGRQGDPGDEWSAGNNIPSINNWLLLGADAMAYAYQLSGNSDHLNWGARLFRTGTRDPFFEGDANTYSATKETVNSITYGHTFLHGWAEE